MSGASRRFPIQGGPSILWAVIAPHDAQAQENHSQSLERLAERGGLSPTEALAVLEDRAYPWLEKVDQKADHDRFAALVEAYDIAFHESALATLTADRDALAALLKEARVILDADGAQDAIALVARIDAASGGK